MLLMRHYGNYTQLWMPQCFPSFTVVQFPSPPLSLFFFFFDETVCKIITNSIIFHFKIIFQIRNEIMLLSHLKSKTHLERVRKAHDDREPSRDELQRFNISQIRDVQSPTHQNGGAVKNSREKQKALKRRERKVKQRLISRGQEWEDSQKNANENQPPAASSNKAKFRRNLKELDKLSTGHAKSSWTSITLASLDRCLGEISRAYVKSVNTCIFFFEFNIV